MKHTKRWLLTGVAVIAIVGLGYVARASHYKTHFLNDTQIDGINVGGQTAAEAAQSVNTKLRHQRYTVVDKTQTLTQFSAHQLGIKPYTTAQVRRLIDKQNAYTWPAHMTTAAASTHQLGQKAIDRTDLNKVSTQIVSLADNANRTPTRNAKLVYKNQAFVIQKEVYGSQVSRTSVNQAITSAVSHHQSQIDLKAAYVKPTVLASSRSLKNAKKTAIKLSKNKITYTLANKKTPFLKRELPVS